MSGPRIFCIRATRAPVVAVLARGPSDWVQLGGWDLEHDEYEHGAWLAGTVYPQRCDLSPDGRWFAYFALKPSSTWDARSTYIVVSRLPWFTALVAWGTDGTWTSGVGFVDDRERWTLPEPAGGMAILFALVTGSSCGAPRRSPSNGDAAGPRPRTRSRRSWTCSGGLGCIRPAARGDDRWTPTGPRRGGPDSAVSWEVDLSAAEPDPRPPPEEA